MSGSAALIACAASMPSIAGLTASSAPPPEAPAGGIRMSVRTASGRDRRTASSSSAAEPTAASTVTCPESSSSRRVPSLTR